MKAVVEGFKNVGWSFHILLLTLLALGIRHTFTSDHKVEYSSIFERGLINSLLIGVTLVSASFLLWMESKGADIEWFGIEDADSRLWITKAVTRGCLIICILMFLF